MVSARSNIDSAETLTVTDNFKSLCQELPKADLRQKEVEA